MLDFFIERDPSLWRLIYDVACTFTLGFLVAWKIRGRQVPEGRRNVHKGPDS